MLELPNDVDDGPVGDAVAVAQACAVDDGRVEPVEELVYDRRDLPTPALPRTVKSWHERSVTAWSYASRSRRISVARPTMRASLRRAGEPITPTSGTRRRFRPCP